MKVPGSSFFSSDAKAQAARSLSDVPKYVK